MHVLVFANGDLDPLERTAALLGVADWVLCADGGTRHALALGIQPDVVIGDLDSLPGEAAERLSGSGTTFLDYPADKDETDLELALLYAADRGATEITVLGGWGGRIDHSLGNVLLMTHPRLAAATTRFVCADQEIVLVRERTVFYGETGDLLSLLPIGGSVCGIVTTGLAYPLCNETLYLGRARGLSNVFVEDKPTVSIGSGLLVAVHTRIPRPVAGQA